MVMFCESWNASFNELKFQKLLNDNTTLFLILTSNPNTILSYFGILEVLFLSHNMILECYIFRRDFSSYLRYYSKSFKNVQFIIYNKVIF